MSAVEPVRIYVEDANSTVYEAQQVGWVDEFGQLYGLQMRTGVVASDQRVYVLAVHVDDDAERRA